MNYNSFQHKQYSYRNIVCVGSVSVGSKAGCNLLEIKILEYSNARPYLIHPV